jgi:hypothetical protein
MTPRQHPERREQAAIVQLLRAIGGQVYIIGTVRRKTDFQGTCQTAGLPDLVCFLYRPRKDTAVQLWIEVKAKGGRLRPAQAEFQSWCQAARVHHVTGGIDHVQNWLVDHGWLQESQRRTA